MFWPILIFGIGFPLLMYVDLHKHKTKSKLRRIIAWFKVPRGDMCYKRVRGRFVDCPYLHVHFACNSGEESYFTCAKYNYQRCDGNKICNIKV